MYPINADDQLATFRVNERELHRATAQENEVRRERERPARPGLARLVASFRQLAQLRPRTS